jgi:NAD+-dependent protein deacetylase sirtuin 4
MTSLLSFFRTSQSSSSKTLVITGAGVSTASGIPDYRSPGRPLYKPLQHAEFISKESVRRRYWARSFIGYSVMANAKPNIAHFALSQLEKLGYINGGLITQNVDRLHQRAGHIDVLELHGTVMECECMNCKSLINRNKVQEKMAKDNKAWEGLAPSKKRSTEASESTLGMLPPDSSSSSSSSCSTSSTSSFPSFSSSQQLLQQPRHSTRPDGDVELDALDLYDPFIIPTCDICGEPALKPRVIFHGGNVDSAVAANAKKRAEECSSLLIIGSTLSTFSAYRLVRDVSLLKKPILILNKGITRGDEHASIKINEDLVFVLSKTIKELTGGKFYHHRESRDD